MIAFLAAIPARDYMWAALAALLLGALAYERYEGKASEAAAVKAENARITVAAEARIAQQTKDYTAQLTAIGNQYATDLSTASAQHNADLARLRAATADKGNSVLCGATAAPGEPATSAGPDRPQSVGDVALQLADALRRDDALLAACRAERASLTGK